MQRNKHENKEVANNGLEMDERTLLANTEWSFPRFLSGDMTH